MNVAGDEASFIHDIHAPQTAGATADLCAEVGNHS